ncbi:MAG: hypothetical protein F6K55_34470 [Moorea sp. SIO4A3]|nr:hypothetical protein [Moorena sp. SIO4A3]
MLTFVKLPKVPLFPAPVLMQSASGGNHGSRWGNGNSEWFEVTVRQARLNQ